MNGVNCDISSGLIDLISSPNGLKDFHNQIVPHIEDSSISAYPPHELTSRLVEHCLAYGLTRKTIGQVVEGGFRSLALLSLLPVEMIASKFADIGDRQRHLLTTCVSALDRYTRPQYQIVRGLQQLQLEDASTRKSIVDKRLHSMESMDKNEVSGALDLMNTVKKLLECPVCYQVCASPRIWQCTNGHLTCDQCHEHSTNCPLCRSAFSNVRPLVIEMLSRQVPLKCKNSGHGCQENLAQREREEHELSCEYTQGHCPVLSCTVMFRIKDTLHHMDTHHSLSVDTACLKLYPGATMCFRSSISMGNYLANSADQQNWWWGPQFLVYETIPFFFVISRRVIEQVDNHQGYFYFWLWIGGNQTEARRFLYTLTIENQEGEKMSYTCPPVSLTSPVSQIRCQQTCLLLTDSAVQRMTIKTDNRGYKLQYRIEILDKKLKK